MPIADYWLIVSSRRASTAGGTVEPSVFGGATRGGACALEDAIDVQAVACGGPRYIIASSAAAKSTMAMPIAAFALVADMTVA